ncbi:MAG: hypothetical protein ACO3DQ_05220 [Cephaloticoccus sp.]
MGLSINISEGKIRRGYTDLYFGRDGGEANSGNGEDQAEERFDFHGYDDWIDSQKSPARQPNRTIA